MKPYPTYRTAPVGFETLSEEYPLLAYNPHYYRRTHSCLDNVLWDREAWASPVYLSPTDAEARGIADGDTVVVSSPAGKCETIEND